MTKSEAKRILVEWLQKANQQIYFFRGEYKFDRTADEWFCKCAEMYAAFKAISDPSTDDQMPIDRPALEMEDFVNDGCNGFTRQ